TLIFSSGLWMYGAWIWYKFLELNYFDEDGYWYDDMYRDSIQSSSYNDPSIYETLSSMLEDKGSNLADAFHLFGIWRIFTGTYADDYHWPVPIGVNLAWAWGHVVDDYPVEDFSVPDARLPQKMATNLIWFSTNTAHEMFAVSFDGQNDAGTEHRIWQVSIVGVRRDGGEPDVWGMDVDNDYNYGSLVISDWSPYLKIAMLITQYGDGNLNPDDPDTSQWARAGTYTYSAWITDVGADVADLAGRTVDEGVLLTWRAEGDVAGFNVYRGTERLNALPLDTEAVSYLDKDAAGGEYYLGLIDPAGVEVRYGPITVDPADSGSRATKLEQNFPSPVAGKTTIRFTLAEAGPVELSVYDLSGRLVDTVVDGELEVGPHACVWDASGRADGVYLYTLTTPDGSLTRRLVVAR
ncbi:MAG: T9SS type A sorting domain-containing protein, partial [bacterium]|nr:T9SS type A sorting domain-containing protein [bacterium]